MGKLRIGSMLCAVVLATATLVGLAPAASADAQFVGGGAAGVMYYNYAEGGPLDAPVRGVLAADAVPSVELPWNGGYESSSIGPGVGTGTIVPGVPWVRIDNAYVQTNGNLQGYPYAASQAMVGFEIEGTAYVGVRTSCIWDRAGARATTQLITQGGQTVAPAINTRIDLPGLGYAIANEQKVERLYTGASVISVRALHVYVQWPTADLDAISDFVIGFASCDPLDVPNLNSLGLVGPDASPSA